MSVLLDLLAKFAFISIGVILFTLWGYGVFWVCSKVIDWCKRYRG